MTTFDELIESRKAWINEILKPWCRQAVRKDLLQAAQEWTDIAGRPDPDATLWTWAWGRFPGLVHENLPGVNETYRVRVTLRDGTTMIGYPDGRASKEGKLALLMDEAPDNNRGPYSIDQIVDVTQLPDSE